MKKLLLIAFFLPLFMSSVSASHILGGEITYTHISAKKYQVNVVVYRDCNECLLDGLGGGESTKNCNKPSLEMKVSSDGVCTGDAIGLIPITRYKIRKILPTCSGTISKCESNSNYAFGIEAHYYRTTIDFSKYNKYNSCGFELFLRATDRSSEISNVSLGTNAKFYNFTYIYPWVNHNSPQLNDNPQMLFVMNKTHTSNILKSNESDSISITSEAPMESKSILSTYNMGYSKAKPLQVHCNPGCTPDRRALPTSGFYLDNKGNVVFTPNKRNDNALVVYQIEKWRTVSGKKIKLSTVRRDVQHIVIGGSNNSPSFADTIEDYYTCVGTKFCQDIEAYDAHTFSSGVPMPADTVNFNWTTNLPSSAEIKTVAINQAPYFKLQICWEPDEDDYRVEPYYVQIELNDNSCPLNATASRIINIHTRQTPDIEPLVELIGCGYISVLSNLNKTVFTTEQWLLRDEQGRMVSSSSTGADTLKTTVTGKHKLEYIATDVYGCQSRHDADFSLNSKFVNPVLIHPIIPIDICEGDRLNIQALASNPADQLTAKWRLGSELIGEEMTLKTEATLEMNKEAMSVEVTKISNGLECTYSRDVDVRVKAVPSISNWDEKRACYSSGLIDLNTEVQPKGGTWHNAQNLINISDRFSTDRWPITPKGGTYSVTYSISDPSSGCTGVKESKIIIEPIPKAELEDVTICRLSGKYQLSQALTNKSDELSYHWASKDQSIAIIDDEFIDLATLQPGKFNFECTVRSATGCESTSGFTITILNTAKIELLELGSVCRSDEGIDLNTLLNAWPLGGTWFDNDLQEEIADGKIPNDFCGVLNVNYTYDQEGCYDSKNTSFEVICKPKITITTPTTICTNITEFAPTATPVGGVWSGTSIRNGKVVIPKGVGSFELIYTLDYNGCSFEEKKIIELEEAPEMHIANLPQEICEGETITVAEPTGYAERWILERGGEEWFETSLNPTQEEISDCKVLLQLKAYGKGLCNTFTEDYVISINPSPQIDLSAAKRGCEPFNFEFKPSFINPKIDASKVAVEWFYNDPYSSKNQSTGLNAKHQYSTAGNYNLGVRLVSDRGCIVETTAENFVSVRERPVASFSSTPDEFLSINDPVMQFFNRSTCADSMRYIWDFGTNKHDNISHKKDPAFEFPKDTGSFTVTLTAISDKQCISSTSKGIYINPDIRLFVPTGFTPNGKGPLASEVFSVSGVNVKTYSIVVWNRWGQIVYQSTDINEVWDGRYGSKLCQPGAFGYKILVTSQSEQDYIFTGVINLLR